MEQYAGIDVSLESASICVVDASGRIVREAKVASEPEALIAWFRMSQVTPTRICLQAGPLSQWLYAGMREARLPVELLETRHVRDAFKAMPVKTDRTDPRGICAPDAAELVPACALQITAGPGTACDTDGSQADAEQAPRFGDEPSRHLARLRVEGEADHAAQLRIPCP